MSCLIVLDDGRACAPASWAFDVLVNAVADNLSEGEDRQPLADWLRQQAEEARLVGRGRIDLRELTPENRQHFREAVQRLAAHHGYCRAADGTAVAVPGWINRLRRLAKMLLSIDRGESPDAISDVPAPIAPTGNLRGPGWRVAV